MRCVVLAAVGAGVAFGAGAAASAQDVVYAETFDAGDGGWTAIDIHESALCYEPGAGSLRSFEHKLSGGAPGGYVTQFEGGAAVPLWRAGVAITANAGAAYGGFLRYDRRIAQGNGAKFGRWDDVYLQGMVDGHDVTLIADTIGYPPSGWFAHRVPLRVGVWRVGECFGPIATEGELIAVLNNLTEVKIAGEYRFGNEDVDIDNVMLIGPGTAPQSTFEFDAEGWGIAGDATILWIDPAGSRPQCIRALDHASGVGFSFAAPAGFLGDQSAAAGMTLELDLVSSVDNDQAQANANENFVVLHGQGFDLGYSNPGSYITGGVWRHYAVPLAPSRAWVRLDAGTVATQSEFDEVLGDLAALTIRGEYRNGGEETTIDNVVLGACSPSGVIDRFEVTTCFGEDLRLEVSAAGRTPFSYVWTKDDVEIDAGANPSALTPVLEIAGLGPEDTGDYRCIISNECGSVTTHTASVAVVVRLADLDGNGVLNFDDLDAFIAAYLAGGPAADLDGSGVVNFDDLDLFIASYLGGCP